MSNANEEGRGLSADAIHEEQLRIERDLREGASQIASGETGAGTSVRLLNEVVEAAVRLRIFAVTQDGEHAHLVRNQRAISNHLILLEDAIELARKTLPKWRELFY